MLRRVQKYIRENDLLKREDKVLVCVSGGADSMALLDVLCRGGYECIVAHCNFHLRGEESNRDEVFVKLECEKRKKNNDRLEIRVREFNTSSYAKTHGISIEMAARNLRYEWFRKEKNNRNADCIAVAHHRDDQAETLLLNILRGTGLRGLAGMHPRNNDIIRPLLCLSRNDILSYLKECNQDYVTDSTNLMSIAQRNHIRLNIIPLLQSLNPAAVEHLCTAAEKCSTDSDFYPAHGRKHFSAASVQFSLFPISCIGNCFT